MRITLTFIALSLLYSSPYAHAQGQTVQSPQVQHNVINDQPARNVRDGFYIRNTQADNFNIGHIEVDQGAKNNRAQPSGRAGHVRRKRKAASYCSGPRLYSSPGRDIGNPFMGTTLFRGS